MLTSYSQFAFCGGGWRLLQTLGNTLAVPVSSHTQAEVIASMISKRIWCKMSGNMTEEVRHEEEIHKLSDKRLYNKIVQSLHPDLWVKYGNSVILADNTHTLQVVNVLYEFLKNPNEKNEKIDYKFKLWILDENSEPFPFEATMDDVSSMEGEERKKYIRVAFEDFVELIQSHGILARLKAAAIPLNEKPKMAELTQDEYDYLMLLQTVFSGMHYGDILAASPFDKTQTNSLLRRLREKKYLIIDSNQDVVLTN